MLTNSKQRFFLSYRPLTLCKNILMKSDYFSKWFYKKKLAEELNFIKLSDQALCVSEKLKEYFLCKNKNINPEKISVIPGSASIESFFINETTRTKIREKLKINEKFVFIYSGRLDKPWQMPDFIFDIFSKLVSNNPNLFLLCLTPNKNLAYKYARKYNIPENNIWADYVKYVDINDYLCAGDAGLLFRENTPTNNVASPTKFAEYCMAGLPVVISEGVGDFSDFARDMNLGLVVNNQSSELINQIESTIVNSNFNKNNIAKIGKDNFSKEGNVGLFLNIFHSYDK
jgi:glycosyltransferase involved in cell wall biosynthesis